MELLRYMLRYNTRYSMKNKINLPLPFSINFSFLPLHSTHCSLHLLLYNLSFAYRRILDTVNRIQIQSSIQITGPPNQLSKVGRGSKGKEKEHIQIKSTNLLNFTLVSGEEYFAILETLNRLFRHFFQYSMHIATCRSSHRRCSVKKDVLKN